MPLEVVFGHEAERDLDDIDDLLAGYSLTAAETLTRRIKAQCARLADFPSAGVSRTDLGEGIRSFAIPEKATVIYQFDTLQLTVLRIFYAGREIDYVPAERDEA